MFLPNFVAHNKVMDMEKKIGKVAALAFCLCPLALQAQKVKMRHSEVKSVSLDTIPKASLPKEVMSPNISFRI